MTFYAYALGLMTYRTGTIRDLDFKMPFSRFLISNNMILPKTLVQVGFDLRAGSSDYNRGESGRLIKREQRRPQQRYIP